MSGKGDTYRPVDYRKWSEGYKRAFGHTKPVKQNKDKPNSK